MALPVFAKFYSKLNKDADYKNYAQAQFKSMKSEWAAELDCDPFKEDFNFFEWLFGKKKDGAEEVSQVPEEKEQDKKGIFQKLKKLFKKD